MVVIVSGDGDLGEMQGMPGAGRSERSHQTVDLWGRVRVRRVLEES